MTQTRMNDGNCRWLCDAALEGIGAALRITLTPREKQLARYIVAGEEVRSLLPLVGGQIALRTLREELRRLYLKAGVRRRAQFTARVFDEYRRWRGTDPPCPCR